MNTQFHLAYPGRTGHTNRMKHVWSLVLLLGTALLHADVVTELRPRIREEAVKRDIDPVLIEAIIRHESAHGTSKAARSKNNLAGIKAGRSLKRYPNKDESVAHLALVLERYKNRGITSPRQLSKRYCSSGARQWERYVNQYMAAIKKGSYGPVAADDSRSSGGLFTQNAPRVEEMGHAAHPGK